MKLAIALMLGTLSTAALAAKPALLCVADDLSPVTVSIYKTTSGLKVTGMIKRKQQIALKATGVLKSDAIDLEIGSQGGSIQSNGFAGIYGVIPVTIPEYDIHALRMTCISETLN